MSITITPMTTEADMLGKAYVHWQSWQETYRGLIDDGYLDKVMTLAKCEAIARRFPQNLWVAKDGERVVGFVGCGAAREGGGDAACGEVYAIYVLREYQGRGVGWALMQTAMAQLRGYDRVMLWVLRGNERAIRFYERYGFVLDGEEKDVVIGTPNVELRMTYVRR